MFVLGTVTPSNGGYGCGGGTRSLASVLALVKIGGHDVVG